MPSHITPEQILLYVKRFAPTAYLYTENGVVMGHHKTLIPTELARTIPVKAFDLVKELRQRTPIALWHRLNRALDLLMAMEANGQMESKSYLQKLNLYENLLFDYEHLDHSAVDSWTQMKGWGVPDDAQ